MKNFFCIILLLISTTISANDMGNKIKILVLPFNIKGDTDNKLSDLFYDSFINAINDTNNYSAISENQFEEIFNISKIQKKDIFNNKEVVKIGKLVKAKIVIICSIIFFDDEYFVSIKGVDTNNGDELFTKTSQAINSIELIQFANALAKFISQNAKRKMKFDFSIMSPNSKIKFCGFLSGGIAFASSGLAIFLAGTIIIPMFFGWYALIPCLIMTPLGLIITPLSAIFFKRAYKIYKYEKLSFFDRVDFNTRFVLAKNSLTNELDRKIDFSISINL